MPKRPKRVWAGLQPCSAGVVDFSPPARDSLPSEAGEELAGLSLDEALADLGAGRKALRQLRAELRLEDDLFSSLLLLWRRDQRRVESALGRVLSASLALATASRLGGAEEVCAVLESAKHPSAWEPLKAAKAGASTPGETAGVSSQPSGLAAVRGRLPRLPPGERIVTEGQEERQRALRRRLQAELSAEAQIALKAAATDLRMQGAQGAGDYLQAVWEALEGQELAEEILIELICAQVDPVLQCALRGALTTLEKQCEKASTDDHPASRRMSSPCIKDGGHDRRGAAYPGPASRPPSTNQTSFFVTILPEPQLIQVLAFCGCPIDIGVFGACSRSLKPFSQEDSLWSAIWARSHFSGGPPGKRVREHFLRQLASQCVECRRPTEFEHGILGCRLCESCERSYPKYALIRYAAADQEYQLPLGALRSLPHFDGATGREKIYLRTSVEAMAERHHSREGLQKLRAQHDVGMTSGGRQRRKVEKEHASRRGASSMSNAREARSRFGSGGDDDPCCYEATALRRANDSGQQSLWSWHGADG
ncbi:unnamed protein product [Polarella glacialis]|uniref:F-box domain-containing protein n=1 Tax=Polarella glacialis TaxID=89957 RepID=A0A813FNK5_POLGL|nr:unnamed protein product [Polarella glacialis]|mmetsp:Transcript_36638/g.59105  ORF Transcript_36638/g.59105 Transcript_36638/m.59105 type:complete len:538 (+) Transcript_36638:118-1731(+)